MPESDYIRKHAVMCLRLAAECRDLAAGVATPELRARVLRMADMWEDLADQPPSENTPDDFGIMLTKPRREATLRRGLGRSRAL